MRKRIVLFNHVNPNGRVYPANSKEEIQKLFNKPEYILVLPTQILKGLPVNSEEFQNQFFTVDLMKAVGKFDNIEIIETGDIGSNDLPIFECFGELHVFDTRLGKWFEENYEQNTVTFGLRTIGKQDVSNDYFILDKIICFDVIASYNNKIA